jgi:hypothetical protein
MGRNLDLALNEDIACVHAIIDEVPRDPVGVFPLHQSPNGRVQPGAFRQGSVMEIDSAFATE